MIDEKTLRAKIDKMLDKPAYGSLHTYERKHIIDDIVQAAKDCETVPTLLTESEEEDEEEEE